MSRLHRLFNPRSIAVIGGGAWCEAVVRQCQKAGYEGRLYAVHPTREHVAGLVAHSNLEALKEAPDAAFIGVNRQATIQIVEDLSAKGAGGAVCFASGFQEAADGAALHQALLDAACDMPILGPNCYGFLNYFEKATIWPDVHGGEPAAKGVAIVTQSSNIALNLTMQNRSLPIGMLVTVGNQAKVGLCDVGMEMLKDERITALGLYVEGFGDIREWEALAKVARQSNKAVIVIKSGRSIAAQSAAITHTASLSGNDAGAHALIKRLGFTRVEDLSVFLEALKLAHVFGRVKASKIASLSCSGGEASLMADAGEKAGLSFPPFSQEQKSVMKAHLSDLVTLANPLDYHTFIWRNRRAMADVFAAAAGPQIDLVIVVLDFPKHQEDHADWLVTLEAVEAAAQDTGASFAVLASLPETMPATVAKRLLDAGVVALCGIAEALTAIAHLADCEGKEPVSAPIWLAALPENTAVFHEGLAKTELAKFGVPVPRHRLAEGAEEAKQLAATLGFPVALKGLGIAHKTEAGAVALNLSDETSVFSAATTMPSSRFLVEEMIQDGVCELLIGVLCDPAHGYLLTLAAGGVWTEILQDRETLLLPVDEAAIEKTLSQLKITPLLNGYRGRPSVDRAAIIKAVLCIQEYVFCNLGQVAEIEVNPLVCTPSRAVAVDALMKRSTSEEEGRQT